jgi:hypothetical protein
VIPPSGSTISSATLNLYCINASTGGGRTIDIHYLTRAWVEGTGTGTITNDGVTWNTYDGTNAWTTAGGDYNGTATTSITVKSQSQWYAWTVTADVNNATNGWILKDNNETVAQLRWAEYNSRTAGSNLPYLLVTFTAPWDSHTDIGRTNPAEDTFASPNTTVYMKGTGFTNGNYNIAYYDATVTGEGNWIATDTNISVSNGELNSAYLLTTNQSAIGGTWHALVQPFSGYTAFPGTYNTAVAAPDTYGLLANDSFTVQQSAIPEFPTVIAGIAVAGTCFAIYYWMRKRKQAYVKA